MSTNIVAAFGDKLNVTAEIYLASFAVAYERFGLPESNFQQSLVAYKDTIKGNMPDIRLVAASRISAYLNMYDVRVVQTADELKLLYYVGRAIAWQLERYGHTALIPVHLFAMIGLMDDRLWYLGISKPRLQRAMTKLIRQRVLFDEMGPTGTYLIYKTLSTVREGLIEPQSQH